VFFVFFFVFFVVKEAECFSHHQQILTASDFVGAALGAENSEW
jgi:hypothetical protein